MRHVYEATRNTPFGYYGVCACGWTTAVYYATAREAWEAVRDHVDAVPRPLDNTDDGWTLL